MTEPKKEIPAGMIALPKGVNLNKFVCDVYDLSAPVNMGQLHYNPAPMAEDEAKQIIDREARNSSNVVVSMDYVNGRQCKMTVWVHNDGTYYIRDKWMDHLNEEFFRLLQRAKVKDTKIKGTDRAMSPEEEAQIKKMRAVNPFMGSRQVNEDD